MSKDLIDVHPRALGRLAGLATLLLAVSVHPAVKAADLTATRTSSFTYYGAGDGTRNGLLKTETIEPDDPQLCVLTTHGYDAYGNESDSSTANCQGAAGRALFTSRGGSALHGSQGVTIAGTQVTIPAGLFPTVSSNALGHSETRVFDPRFGVAMRVSSANNLATQLSLDDFGRKTRELRPDGTVTLTYYCVLPSAQRDTSANTPGCPLPPAGEIPPPAVMYVHTESRDTANRQLGAFVRVYSDELGREVRSVTQGFDGNVPGGGTIRTVARDSVYNAHGALELETRPYYLDQGSTNSTGRNDVGVTKTLHDALGRPTDVYVSDPGGNAGTVTFGGAGGVSYGVYGQQTAAHTGISHAGLDTSVVNDKGQSRREEKNVAGELVRVTDATGAQLVHQRDPFGNLVATKDALGNVVRITYDVRGRKKQMVDPDTGTWNYDYDALGQLVWQQSPQQAAAQTQTVMTYDALGRVLYRTEPEFVSSWYYERNADGSGCMANDATLGKGKLCQVVTSHGIDRKMAYDSMGRPASSRTIVNDGLSWGFSQTYDPTTGLPSSTTYPTGLKVGYGYTAGLQALQSLKLLTPATVNPLPDAPGGKPGTSKNLPANTVLWQANAADALGRVEQETFGNAVQANAAYDGGSGRIKSLAAGVGGGGVVLSQRYAWDSLGNLAGRIDDNGAGDGIAVSEAFTYEDRLNRLTRYEVSAPGIVGQTRTVDLQYNALGMLLYKSDVGAYSYGPQGIAGVSPHALRSVTGATTTSYEYDANGNLKSASGGKYTGVRYTSFNLPDSTNGLTGPGAQYAWSYDADHARIKEVRKTSAGTRTTWYMHPDNQGGLGFEAEIDNASLAQQNRHYLSAGGQVIGVLVSQGALPRLVADKPPVASSIVLSKVEYWHKDQLGSLISTTDHEGKVTQRYAFDPFGKRRYANGSYDDFGNLVIDWNANLSWGTDRGFTGHEHLDDVGLVHMNGRIFDPTLGVFLQADPLIQQQANLQNYQRYGYCLNNPLTCVDPSGHSFWTNPLSNPLHTVHMFFFWSQGNPFVYYVNQRVAQTKVGYQAGSVAIAVVSAYFCEGAAPACNAAGQAAWSKFAGYSDRDSLKTGLISGATSYAFQVVGDWSGAGKVGYSKVGNVAGHMLVGCASSVAGGGDCRSGAISAGFGAGFTNYGPSLSTNIVIGTMEHALVGGIGSVLSGGRFADGARAGAFGYLFNCVAHKCNAADYDANDSRTHTSAPQSTGTICNLSTEGCLSAVRTEMSCRSAPGQIGCTGVGQEASYDLTGLTSKNPITQYRVNEDMLINGTSPGHVLHDGYVVRWVSVDPVGNVSIWTAGYGTNTHFVTRWANQFGGPTLFSGIGSRNKLKVQCQLKLRSFGC